MCRQQFGEYAVAACLVCPFCPQVGAIALENESDVQELVSELLPLLSVPYAGALGLDEPAVTAALLQYSISIPDAVPSKDMALTEFAWRNGALLKLAVTDVHMRWLQQAGVPQDVLFESLFS